MLKFRNGKSHFVAEDFFPVYFLPFTLGRIYEISEIKMVLYDRETYVRSETQNVLFVS